MALYLLDQAFSYNSSYVYMGKINVKNKICLQTIGFFSIFVEDFYPTKLKTSFVFNYSAFDYVYIGKYFIT